MMKAVNIRVRRNDYNTVILHTFILQGRNSKYKTETGDSPLQSLDGSTVR